MSTPTLKHTIKDDGCQVVDVTSTGNHLFVLREPSRQQIHVYETRTLTKQQTIHVKGLSNNTQDSGLASDATNNCIHVYVSDPSKDTVYKIDLSDDRKVFSWRVGSQPCGLSINSSGNLIVACGVANKLQEYTTSGSLVREIRLVSNDVELRPCHAIQLTSGQFAVGCWNGKLRPDAVYDVIEVDKEGQVVVRYTNQFQSTNQQFNLPRRLAVDRNNEYILVADCGNDRIVVLDRSLIFCACDLKQTSDDLELQKPSAIFLDETNNRLIVAESIGKCRVLVFDKVM